MPGVEVVRHQNLGDERRGVHEQQDDSGNHGHAMALELPPHEQPLRGEVETFLLGREASRRRGIERRVRDEMARLTRQRSEPLRAHRAAPPASRIRGSSAISARSEISTPMTIISARNIRNEPARYMSWLFSALSSIGPAVGSDSTTAVISVPEMMC